MYIKDNVHNAWEMIIFHYLLFNPCPSMPEIYIFSSDIFLHLTFTTLKYVCMNHVDKIFFFAILNHHKLLS